MPASAPLSSVLKQSELSRGCGSGAPLPLRLVLLTYRTRCLPCRPHSSSVAPATASPSTAAARAAAAAAAGSVAPGGLQAAAPAGRASSADTTAPPPGAGEAALSGPPVTPVVSCTATVALSELVPAAAASWGSALAPHAASSAAASPSHQETLLSFQGLQAGLVSTGAAHLPGATQRVDAVLRGSSTIVSLGSISSAPGSPADTPVGGVAAAAAAATVKAATPGSGSPTVTEAAGLRSGGTGGHRRQHGATQQSQSLAQLAQYSQGGQSAAAAGEWREGFDPAAATAPCASPPGHSIAATLAAGVPSGAKAEGRARAAASAASAARPHLVEGGRSERNPASSIARHAGAAASRDGVEPQQVRAGQAATSTLRFHAAIDPSFSARDMSRCRAVRFAASTRGRSGRSAAPGAFTRRRRSGSGRTSHALS